MGVLCVGEDLESVLALALSPVLVLAKNKFVLFWCLFLFGVTMAFGLCFCFLMFFGFCIFSGGIESTFSSTDSLAALLEMLLAAFLVASELVEVPAVVVPVLVLVLELLALRNGRVSCLAAELALK